MPIKMVRSLPMRGTRQSPRKQRISVQLFLGLVFYFAFRNLKKLFSLAYNSKNSLYFYFVSKETKAMFEKLLITLRAEWAIEREDPLLANYSVFSYNTQYEDPVSILRHATF